MKNITQIEKAILGNDNLDEHEKQYEERKQKTDRAKALLDDILSACEGSGIGNENADWATRGLLEILELFTFNKNSKVTPQDMAEDLQRHLFTWTFKHGDVYSQWRDDYFSGKWYAELNEEKESSDAPEAQTQTEQPKAKTLAEHHLQIMANKISHILRSDKVSDDARAAFSNIIFNAANESNIGVDEPELIKISLPLIVNSLEFEYGRGVVSSLSAILDSSLVDSVEDELRQYEKRFDGRDSEFDGSPSQPDGLDVSDSSMKDLAQKLSDIMHDPHLPEKIHNCLADELAGNCIDFRTPESILGNLKEMKKAEVEND